MSTFRREFDTEFFYKQILFFMLENTGEKCKIQSGPLIMEHPLHEK